MKKLIFISLIFSFSAFAWDGYDYDSGSYVEIEKGNLVREGREIEFYDYGSGEYRTGTVNDISTLGSGASVEIQDNETGETRTLEMD